MRTSARGNATEAAVLHALVQHGIDVLVPFGEGQPYDLVVHLPPDKFLRIQCKTAWPNRGCLIFNSRATDHGRGAASYSGLAELFGVYFPPTQSAYLVPVQVFPGTEGRLRLEPARNNQRKRIRLAADYEIGRWSVDALCELAARIP
jgi:hypothetical protein